jgi:hypothetical protein
LWDWIDGSQVSVMHHSYTPNYEKMRMTHN